jgi:cytochrome bd-type quinol oxidase subunit 2
MPDLNRKKQARAAANEYARKPEGSSLLYGLIAVALLGLAMVGFEMFYQANIFAYPLLISIALVGAFLGGIVLRKRRKGLHVAAFEAEYERQGKR